MTNDGHKEIRNGELLAAVDLGSNSFHLVVARYEHGELRVIDRLRDSVRLAAGLRADGGLDEERRDKALACLARFGQRLHVLPNERVRAVATNTVRRLRVPADFLGPAEDALGHPIEVVSGREEARLIYLGVAHGVPDSPERRLVIDIGGGSTEFIIGQHFEALEKESLQMGCVASTLRFFEDGKLSAKRWQRAQTEIAVELQQFAADYRTKGWSETIGSSGTAKAIGNVAQAAGWCETGISRTSLEHIRDAIIDCGSIDKLRLPGLAEDRMGVFAGGVAILEASFVALDIRQMRVCETAMREGLLYDMVGRAEHRDPRTATIDALAQRYGVDRVHAARVEATALTLFDSIAADWQLGADERDWLAWAARIHEIGLAIAHSQHHIHSAYIVENSDLAGFARHEQLTLAVVLRCHRRKPDIGIINIVAERLRRSTARVTALLRIAVLLQRARGVEALPSFELRIEDKALQLRLPQTWLEEHPLTRTDLDQERDYLKHIDIKLQVKASEKLAA
ncbi:MAG TPA: exopolyphosphatase [Rudaea sp.]|uniref:exopolyphosphatase n=1 Tax=Rudaea sp. TaxID=2136325 RepID=UPI002F94602C